MASNRRSVSIRINGKEIENSMGAIRKEARLIRRELDKLVIGSEEYNKKAAELKRVNGIMKQHRDNIRGTQGALTKMQAGLSGFVGIAAAAFTVDRLVNFTGELFQLGTEMEVLGRKAETVFGDVLPKVTAAAEANANAMGLTTGQYIDAAAAIQDLLVPMGFQREEAAGISTELVNLSGPLSEWTGGQRSAAEVSDILSKAILGEREQLKSLGISISEADVQTRLAEKGLKGLTGEMLQQAKAAVTLELITEKTVDAQSAFANNSETLVRRQAELRAQFQEVKEAMATALIPVFHRLFEAAAPVITSFGDFITKLINGEQATGKYAGILNFLVTRLQNTGKFIRFVLALFQQLGNWLFDNFGGVIEFVVVKLAQLQNIGAMTLNSLAKFTNIEITFKEVDISAIRKSFDDIRQARADSQVDAPIEPTVNAGSGSSFSPLAVNDLAGSGDQDAVSKQAEKSIQALDKLQQKVQQLRTEFETGLLPEEEQAIAKIEQLYDAELAKALELSQSNNQEVAEKALQQVLELEALKQQAIAEEQEKQFLARLERDNEHAEKLLQAETDRFQREQELRAELNEFLTEENLSEREKELEELRVYYDALALAAEEFGIDITEETQRYREEINRINKEYDEKDEKDRNAALKKQFEETAKAYGKISAAVEGFQRLAESTGKRGAALAKTLALINIAAKSAEAIASGVAASAGLPFPANLPAIASTVATVLANVATARQILSDAPDVPQRRKGGFFDVIGASDGQNYNAKYLGRPGTGMLPGNPSLVLASEAGPEYFVANEDLRNPVVLNHVRAIENVRKARLGQFRDGGATSDLPSSGSASAAASNTMEARELIDTLNKLNDILERGIPAIVPDQTAVDIKLRLEELSAISGGAI